VLVGRRYAISVGRGVLLLVEGVFLGAEICLLKCVGRKVMGACSGINIPTAICADSRAVLTQ
jgi:hypothetical protein